MISVVIEMLLSNVYVFGPSELMTKCCIKSGIYVNWLLWNICYRFVYDW
jgi:hypothetical protein